MKKKCVYCILLFIFAVLILFIGLLLRKSNNTKMRYHDYVPDGYTIEYKVYNIRWGDTLTSIADSYDEEIPTYAKIEYICKINKLKGDKITSGATLVIPYIVKEE